MEKTLSYVYLAIVLLIALFARDYFLAIICSSLIWLSIRGIVSQKLLVGSKTILTYGAFTGIKARLLSVVILVVVGYLYINLILTKNLNVLAIVIISLYPPLLMSLGKHLRLQREAKQPSISQAK